MNKAFLLFLLFLCPSMCTKRAYEQSFIYQLHNDSSNNVTFLIPCFDLLWDCGPDLDAIDTHDTTLTYYGTMMYNNGPCDRRVSPYSSSEEYSGYSSIEQIVPKDTIRLFIYETKAIRGESIEEYFSSLNLLQRYDLSLDDLVLLTNPQGKLELHWPPDKRMQHMKMWPNYSSFK